jgi:hypothetical protein
MTLSRSISAVLLLTASGSALAETPKALVVLDDGTGEIRLVPSGAALGMDQTPLGAMFQDDGGLREIRANPDQMMVDTLFEDPDAFGFDYSYEGLGAPGVLQTTYRPLGFILAIEGGGAEIFTRTPGSPLQVHFSDGWRNPMVYTSSNAGTVVTTGSDNLIGFLVSNGDGGQDVVVNRLGPGTLELAVESTMLWDVN